MKRRRRRLVSGRKKTKKSPKVKLLDNLRTWKSYAVLARLKGRIQDATHWEGYVDRAYSDAEKKGWDESATKAEEAGGRIGHRAYRKAQG